MLDCLEQNPRRRPSAQQIIERLRKIPVSSREHAPALPPNTLRPSTPAEAAAEAAAKAKAAAATASAAAAAATAAAQQAAAGKQTPQRRQERARQQGERQGQETAGGHAGVAAALTPLLASDPSSPGSPGSQAPVSAFAAAAAAADVVGTSTPTSRTASNASELLSGPAASCLQSPLPPGFAGAAIAPAGSLPTPFSNKLAAVEGDPPEPALEKQPSSAAGTQLPAWSSSDELGSRDPRSSYEQQRSSLELSRAASGGLQAPSPQAVGARSHTVGVTLGRRGSIPLPPGAPGSGRASPFAAARDSLSPRAVD